MTELTQSRKQRLRACETILADHMEEFVKVGMALREIRDERLYKEDGFETFEAYCKKKWELSKRYAYRIMEAAEIRLKLPSPQGGPVGHSDGPQWTERSVRELGRLGTTTKAKAVAERVLKAVEKDGGKLTSTIVRKHVDEEMGIKRGKPKPQPVPSFSQVVYGWAGKLNGIADVIDAVPKDALRLFGKDEPKLANDLASAIERVKKSLARVWDALP